MSSAAFAAGRGLPNHGLVTEARESLPDGADMTLTDAIVESASQTSLPRISIPPIASG